MSAAFSWHAALTDLRARRAAGPAPAERRRPAPRRFCAAAPVRAPREPDDDRRLDAFDLGISRRMR